MWAVIKNIGLTKRRFKNYNTALSFWTKNKHYNALVELIPKTRFVNGKEKRVYRSRYIHWRSSYTKQDKQWKVK